MQTARRATGCVRRRCGRRFAGCGCRRTCPTTWPRPLLRQPGSSRTWCSKESARAGTTTCRCRSPSTRCIRSWRARRPSGAGSAGSGRHVTGSGNWPLGEFRVVSPVAAWATALSDPRLHEIDALIIADALMSLSDGPASPADLRTALAPRRRRGAPRAAPVAQGPAPPGGAGGGWLARHRRHRRGPARRPCTQPPSRRSAARPRYAVAGCERWLTAG